MHHFHGAVKHNRRFGRDEQGSWSRVEAMVAVAVAGPFMAILTLIFAGVGCLAMVTLPIVAPLFFAVAAFCGYVTFKALCALVYVICCEVANYSAHVQHRIHTKGTAKP